MSGWHRAGINVLSSWATMIVVAVTGFFLSPFVVHSLGSISYGAWALLGSLVGYLGLVDLGVRGAVTKYVSTYQASGNHEKASQIVSSGLVFFSMASLVVLIVSGVLALVLDRILEIPPQLVSDVRLALVMTGLTLGISIIGGVYGGVVVALQRFDAVNGVEILMTLLRTAATVWALRRGGGIVALATVQLLTAVVRTVVQWVLALRLYPELNLGLHGGWALIAKVVSFGAITTLLNLPSTVMAYSNSIVIGYFLPFEAITFFAIATSLIGYARMVISGVSQPLAPAVASLEGRGELDRVGRVLLTSGRFATLAVMPVLATLVVRGQGFIGLWMGEEFAAPVGPVLVLLSVATWVFSSFQILTSAMIGIGRHRGMVAAFIAEAVANLLLSVILIRSLGLIGVALGLLLPRLVVSGGFGPVYARAVLGTSIAIYWWQMLLRPMLAILPFAGISWLIEMWWPATSLWMFFAQVAALLPVAGLGAWVGGLEVEERRTVLAMVVLRWRNLRDASVRVRNGSSG